MSSRATLDITKFNPSSDIRSAAVTLKNSELNSFLTIKYRSKIESVPKIAATNLHPNSLLPKS